MTQHNHTIRIVFLFLLSLGGFLNASAQHPLNLEPLSINPRIAQEEFNQEKTLFPAGNNVYYFDDTLSLPFFDDFSKDRFKDFRLYQYTGIYLDTLPYFKTVNYAQEFPDSVWYLFTQPDSFVVNTDSTFITFTPQTPQFKIYIYDTLVNPYRIADSLVVWQFLPKMSDVVNGNPVYDESFQPDGKIYNFQKEYIIVPASPSTDKSLWVDRHVYVNNGIAVNPPSIGVAVFDGIGMNGMPYATNENAYGVADYLTSKPIDLNGLLPGDSLYLSFYIQPQGIGFFPEPKDSLVLEFKSPVNDKWTRAWGIAGSTLKPFRQIMVPILNAEWFVKGFQFRFKNYAGLAANMDHWLLDYVRLDANRSKQDTVYNDVAFVSRATTILNRYEQMPASQFVQAEINQKWENTLNNLWNQNKWITYGHTLFNGDGDSLTSYPYDALPGPYDTAAIEPFISNGYHDYFRHSLPEFSYLFDVSEPVCCPLPDSSKFTVRHVVQNLQSQSGPLAYDLYTGNDTIYREQTFYNFFAYDDGEAEGSFFLGSVGQIAYEFEMNFADTLRAVQFYFNPQKPNISNNNFEIRIWRTLNDTEEDTLYAQTFIKPQYNNLGPNMFTTYILDRPVALPVGKFYVGWRQNTQFKMNVGFDKNWDNADKIFYKTTGEWFSFADIPGYEGSFMIRPVVGAPVTAEDFISIEEPEPVITEVRVFPNPSGGLFYYELSSSMPNDLEISVVDMSGKIVRTQRGDFAGTLDLSGLGNGIYFARFQAQSNAMYSVHKLIIAN